MALYRGDPVLESLRDVGNSLRSASGDVLQRRRLDIEEQGLLGRQEQERNLQQVRTQAAAATGEAELTRARGGVAVTQQGMEIARAAEGRAEAMHPLQMGAAQAGIEATQQTTQRSRELLPLEKAGMAADTTYKRAAAAHQSEMAATSRAQRLELTRPVNLIPLTAMLDASGQKPMADLIRGAWGPNEQPTKADFDFHLKLLNGYFPRGVNEMKLGGLQQEYDQETDPLKRVDLQQKINQTRIDIGLNPRDDTERLDSDLVSMAREAARAKDPETIKTLNERMSSLLRVRQGMLLKGKQKPRNLDELVRDSHLTTQTLSELMGSASTSLGHNSLGGLDNYVIDRGLVDPPHENYITPNALYGKVAGAVPPATPDEMNIYQRGGTLMNGTVVQGDPNIKTQADADARKREIFVMDKWKQIGGDDRKLNAALQPAPPAAAPTTTLGSARPAPTPQSTIETEVDRRLRTGRGTTASPEQRQQMRETIQQERQQAEAPEALRQEAIRRLLSSGRRTTVPSESQIQQMIEGIQRERERRGTGSIPPTGATEMQDR